MQGRKSFKKCWVEIYSPRLNRASFLSTQMVAKGKNAAPKANTKSSSSHRKIFFAGKTSSRYSVKKSP